MLQEFRSFVLRGNAVDLAVGVAVGAAFGSVVTSLTENLLTPLLAIPGDAARFADLTFTLGGAAFRYGAVIDALIAFLLVTATLFFLVVAPMNRLVRRQRAEPDKVDPKRDCPQCLSRVPMAARRCTFCTAELAPGV